MSVKKVKKEFTVWLTEDWDGFCKGSCLHVEKESKNFYYGIHSSMIGSCQVKFLKKECTKTDPMKKILNTMGEYLKTSAGKKRAEEMRKLMK